MSDTCNATERVRSQLHICNLPMNHEGDHDSGTHQWPREGNSYAGEIPREAD